MNESGNVVTLQDIINEKEEMNYEELRNVAGRVIEGTATITRLDSKEEQGRISGGRRNVEASILLGANAETERGDGTTVSGRGESQAPEKLLERYAKDTGCWYDYDEDIRKWEFYDRGQEAVIFKGDRGFINKVLFYNSLDDITPLRALDDRISLHNYLSPETHYELLGFTKKDGRFAFVLKQPFIQKTGKVTEQELVSYMKENFDMESLDTGNRTFHNSNYTLDDMHLKNVIKGRKGVLYLIDTQFSLNEKGEGIGGVREYIPLNVIDPTPRFDI